ncbi:MAG: hypothetical protein PHO86_01175 [Bacilli bacterium]|nr:hypothetical protein [Bacilli bacterium]
MENKLIINKIDELYQKLFSQEEIQNFKYNNEWITIENFGKEADYSTSTDKTDFSLEMINGNK